MPTRLVLASAACLALMIAAAPPESAAANTETPRYTVHLVKVDVRLVAEQVSLLTGKTMIIDPRVRKLVTLDTPTPASAKELYEAFVRVLTEQGLQVTVRRDGVVQIAPMDRADLTWI